VERAWFSGPLVTSQRRKSLWLRNLLPVPMVALCGARFSAQTASSRRSSFRCAPGRKFWSPPGGPEGLQNLLLGAHLQENPLADAVWAENLARAATGTGRKLASDSPLRRCPVGTSGPFQCFMQRMGKARVLTNQLRKHTARLAKHRPTFRCTSPFVTMS
jgi:hypothetical protein